MPSRILVIEDEPANIQTLSTLLKERGYQINIATNGGQALQVLARIRPDLILLDVMMPEMDGFETCRRLKASEQWRQIPVIFLTAKTETADIVKGFELGAVDYVGKPFNAHELLARVHTHLTINRLHRENERLLLNILPAAVADHAGVWCRPRRLLALAHRRQYRAGRRGDYWAQEIHLRSLG